MARLSHTSFAQLNSRTMRRSHYPRTCPSNLGALIVERKERRNERRGMTTETLGRVIDLAQSFGRFHRSSSWRSNYRKSITGLALRASTGQPQFLSILSRNGRGGTQARSGAVNLRFTRNRTSFPRCSLARSFSCSCYTGRVAASNVAGSRDIMKCARACFFRNVEFIDAPKSSVELRNIRARRTRIAETRDRSSPGFFLFFLPSDPSTWSGATFYTGHKRKARVV